MTTAPETAPDRLPVPGHAVLTQEFRTLKLAMDGPVLVVKIDHPDNEYNLVDSTLMEEFADLMSHLRNQNDARAIVVTGNDRCFSGGGSFELMGQLNRPAFADYVSRLAKQLISDMLQVPVPIVCAMNGAAVGFGATWVLLSDVVFAGEDVSLSDPHVLRGIAAPDEAALWSLAMGPVRAKRYLLTGEKLSATQAAELGLITFVTPAGKSLEQATDFAKKLASQAPSAVAHIKLLCNIHIRDAIDKSFDTGAAWESQEFRTDDHREAIAAFRERREPRFHGT